MCVLLAACSQLLHYLKHGKRSTKVLVDYAVEMMGHDSDAPVPKRVTNWIARCHAEYLGSPNAGKDAKSRYRRCGLQGRPPHRELDYALLNWWADHRAAVRSRINTHTLLLQARRLCKVIINICHKQGQDTPNLPEINLGWVRHWCERFHVSLKKNSVRYQVSHSKVKRRCKRAWLTCFKVRHACELLYGAERRKMFLPPGPYLHVTDQKPARFNESESAGLGSLDWAGVSDTPLKSDISGGKSRYSADTHMCNDPLFDPPLEQCFKLKTDLKIKALIIPAGVRMAVVHSDSGSYDTELMLKYIRRWIPEWTEERRMQRDIRTSV